MIISDPHRFIQTVDRDWVLGKSDIERYARFLSMDDVSAIENEIGIGYDDTLIWTDDDDTQ
jgi:hypothetical protein